MGTRVFLLTDEHLALLRHANVTWDHCEFGAPAIDCKRPYGNSDVLSDIACILGYPESAREEEETTDMFRAIHKETMTALQIVLATGGFEAGRYVAPEYTSRWTKDTA
jgi:hypothetical protein